MDIDYDNLLEESDNEEDREDREDHEGQEQDGDFGDFGDYDYDMLKESQRESDIDDNLTMYLETLENKLQEGKLDDYTFMLENLLIKYKQALMHRRFNIDNELDAQKIDRIREFKKELEEQLIKGDIDEFEFNKKYYNLLDFEYKLLLKYEDFSLKSVKVKDQVPKSFDKGIDELIKSEHTYFKKIAKQRNIEWPSKIKMTKKDSPKVKLQKYLTYYLQLEKAISEAKKYVPGYKIRTIEETTKADTDIKWVLDYPNTLKIDKLREELESQKKERVDYSDPIENLKLQRIMALLRTKSKEQLLSCITEANIINKLSYIEKLKLNTVPVMKLREYPETYEKLEEILGEEAKYYKISSNDLTKDFVKNFNSVSSNVDLKDIPKTFNPVYYVKTKKSFHRTLLPDAFNTEQDYAQVENKIQPSSLGYSFLLKVNQMPSQNKKRHLYNNYTEKGSVVTLSLKPEYFKSDKVLSGVIDEKFYNIIKPLPDDLYEYLKKQNLPENKTELSEVYELHIPVPEISRSNKHVKLCRRYEDFNDYLRDLLSILEINMLQLENDDALKSADVLCKNIQKIKRYLETGKDPEYELSDTYSLDTLIEQSPQIIMSRINGINKLREYVFQFYPNNEEIVEVLENDIFNFNNKDYSDNIDKVVFIFKEFSSSLDNYINKELSFIDLIGMELPYIKPKDDLPEYFTDPKKTFKYLYSWMPKVDLYNIHKTQLEESNFNIIKFKKQNVDLSDLEVNEIFSQYFEFKQWEKSKIKLNTIVIPKGKNPVRVMLDFLKTERNKLMSRRIFRVATIRDRINVRNGLYRIFSRCNLQDFDSKQITDLCENIEIIIYTYSDKPDIYYYYEDLVKNSYTDLCNLLTEPKVVIPVITEFIIKEGDLKYINIARLNTIINTLDSQNFDLILKLLKVMRDSELKAYQKTFIEQQNKIPDNFKQKLISTINKVIEENKQKKKELMYSIAENTYIPPVITNIVPKIQTGTGEGGYLSFYVPKYYIIGENEYLYGGNFPNYTNSETGNLNYTDDDIYSLASLLKIEYVTFEEYEGKTNKDKSSYIKHLYNLCKEKLLNSSSEEKQVIPKDVAINYNPTLIKKKIYTSFINYIYKKRMGVKDPGEVYIVYKDTIDVTYAVPFKTSELGIPVYSTKFLEPEIKKYYYIEGPAEFEETTDVNFLRSTMYILVEYSDKYGKSKLFREGVNPKYVKRSPKENFDACNRFTSEISCNDINSYGLEKMKCRFIRNKCMSVKQEIKKQEYLLDISNLTFTRKISKFDNKGKQKEITDYNKTKLWNEAIKKSNEYISQIILIKKLNPAQIQEVAKEQKAKLIGYYNFLLQLDIKKPKLETIIEDISYNNIKQLVDFLLPEGPEGPEGQQEQEKSDLEDVIKYDNIKLPALTIKNKALSSRQLIVGNKYLLPDNTVSMLLEKKKNELLFDNGETLEISKVTIREEIATTLIEEKFFKINKDDIELIKNPPKEFNYFLYEKEYEYDKSNIAIKTKRKEVKDIPLDILYLTHLETLQLDDKLPKDIINRATIYKTMGKVMYCLYQRDTNNFLESLDVFSATIDAKIYALKYSIDLIELSKKIKGDIELSDVINSYNKVLPSVKTVTQEIISQLEYGILNKDFKLLDKYVKIAKKQKLNESDTVVSQISKLVLDAKNLLDEKEKIKQQQKEEPIKKPEKETTKEEPKVETPKISYVITKRRKKKNSED